MQHMGMEYLKDIGALLVRGSSRSPRHLRLGGDDVAGDVEASPRTDGCIVYPTAPWKTRWDSAMVVMILYSVVTVPVHLAFKQSGRGFLFVVDTTVSLCFLGDMLLNFFLAYLDVDVWITNRYDIACRYLRGWFWIDAPASIPVELIELAFTQFADSVDSLVGLRALRLFRLVRMLKLLRIDTYIGHGIEQLEDNFAINLRALRVLQLVFKLLLLAHFVGCGWIAMVTWQENEDEVNWLDAYVEDGSSDSQARQYQLAFYFAMTTLVGADRSGIKPQTHVEITYDTMAALLAALIFGYIVGEIGTLLAALDRQAALVDEKMSAVKEYLRWRELPRTLSARVRRYYEHFYTRRAVFDERTILQDLTPELRADVVSYVLRGTLRQLPLAQKLSPEFQELLFPMLKPLSASPGELIYAKGATSNDLLFLLSGSVNLLSVYDNETPVVRLSPGEKAVLSSQQQIVHSKPWEGCLGQGALLGSRREATYVAHSACELLAVEKSDVLQLFTADSLSAGRFCNAVLKDWKRDEALKTIVNKWHVNSLPAGPKRAAFLIQDGWRRRCDNLALRHDELYKIIDRAQRRYKTEVSLRASSMKEQSTKQGFSFGVRRDSIKASSGSQLASQILPSQSVTNALSAAGSLPPSMPSASLEGRTTRRGVRVLNILPDAGPEKDAAQPDAQLTTRLQSVEQKLDLILQQMNASTRYSPMLGSTKV